jgi:aspartyl-tRNA(Asn)/glutamyl-tRNA(Gln) amidotransferase subunit C
MDGAEVRKIASLARLELADAEVDRFATQLTAILGYFEKLREVATEGVPPASHPPELKGPVRPDVAAPWPDPAALVKLSRGAEGEFYRVPRVLE